MASRVPPRAASRYKQVRLQFTEEAGGLVSASLYVKPLNTEWTEHNCIWRRSARREGTLDTFEDVVHFLIVLLEEECLPGIG